MDDRLGYIDCNRPKYMNNKIKTTYKLKIRTMSAGLDEECLVKFCSSGIYLSVDKLELSVRASFSSSQRMINLLMLSGSAKASIAF